MRVGFVLDATTYVGRRIGTCTKIYIYIYMKWRCAFCVRVDIIIHIIYTYNDLTIQYIDEREKQQTTIIVCRYLTNKVGGSH